MIAGRVQERGSAPLRPILRDRGLSPGLRLNRGQVHQGNAGRTHPSANNIKSKSSKASKRAASAGPRRQPEEHGGYLGEGDEAEKTELRPGATPRWWRFLSTAWLVPPPPAGLPRRTAPSAPCPGLRSRWTLLPFLWPQPGRSPQPRRPTRQGSAPPRQPGPGRSSHFL